jgi:hypothetical protein
MATTTAWLPDVPGGGDRFPSRCTDSAGLLSSLEEDPVEVAAVATHNRPARPTSRTHASTNHPEVEGGFAARTRQGQRASAGAGTSGHDIGWPRRRQTWSMGLAAARPGSLSWNWGGRVWVVSVRRQGCGRLCVVPTTHVKMGSSPGEAVDAGVPLTLRFLSQQEPCQRILRPTNLCCPCQGICLGVGWLEDALMRFLRVEEP